MCFFSRSRFVVRQRYYRPVLEAMEDRRVPTVTVTTLSNTTIRIIGDAANDTVTITQDDAANRIRVEHDGVTNTFTSRNILGYQIVLGEGSDNLSFKLASDFAVSKVMSVYLDNQNALPNSGTGNDTAIFDFGKFKSHDLDAGLSLGVRGGGGSDNVRADFGNTLGTVRVVYDVVLGDGNDRAEAYMWGVWRDSSTMQTILNGDAGNDRLYFYNDNGTHSSAGMNVHLLGGTGDDSLSQFFDDVVVGRLNYLVSGGDGNDTIDCKLHTRGVSPGTLSSNISGGNGNDSVKLDMEQVRGNVNITLRTEAGDDAVQATFARPGAVHALENAKLTFRTGLGAGNDRCDVNVQGVLRGTSNANIGVYGEQGRDTLTFRSDNGSNVGTLMSVYLDGGLDADTLVAFYDDNAIGNYTMSLIGGDGNDTINSTVFMHGGSTGNLNLSINAGNGDDRIKATLQLDVGATGRLGAALNGGIGRDILTLSAIDNADDGKMSVNSAS